MTREMRELQMRLAELERQARLAISERRVEDAERIMNDVRAVRKQIALLEELEAQERAAATPPGERRDAKELEAEYRRVFLKAVRRKPLSAEEVGLIRDYQRHVFAVLHEGGVTGDPGDAGLLVPQDLQTRINEILRDMPDLTQYVRVERVSTLSGSRVLEADEDMTPLVVVDEYGQIQPMDEPKFTSVPYKLVKRAGFLPITNELLADSDQNIMAYLADWIARKTLVTRNTLIVTLLNTLTATTLANLDAIKKVLNVDLDPAISLGAVIITNQDGYHWLDTQKDSQGRYLLQDDITQPGRKTLFGRPIQPVSNRYLPSRVDQTAGKTYAPIFLGNGKQFAVWFTRGQYELASTREGGEAWRRDATELRVITRDDLKTWDGAAMVKGELDVTPAV